jgi:hypothetical protein
VDRLNQFLSDNLHNYALCLVLVLECACVVAVLIFPNETRLSMAKDVGGLVAMIMGVIGGVHGWKAVAGMNGGAKPPVPPQ